MSDKSMIVGQLYRVGVTCIAAHERCMMEMLIIATSNEDAKSRLPWVFDFIGWASYRVDWVAKEPARCVVLKTKYERTPENEPDAVVARTEGVQAVFQRTPLVAGKKYSVMAQVVLYAKNPDHAKKKLSERVDGGSESIRYTIEEMAEVSAYAVARDVSMYNRASFVRG